MNKVIDRIKNELKKFSTPVHFQGNAKEEFKKVIAPKRYKIPVFGNLDEKNCLYVDFLFVSKYNKDEAFNKPTQWKKSEPVKVYAKLVGKNDNSKILFDILEKLKFSKNRKAQDALVQHCVDILKNEIESVKTNANFLYKLIKQKDTRNQRKNMALVLSSIPVIIIFFILVNFLRS